MNKTILSIFFAIFLASAVVACVDKSTDGPNEPVEPVDTTGRIDPPVDPVDTIPVPSDTIPAPGDTVTEPQDTVPAVPDPPVVTEKQYDTIVLRIMDYNVGRLHKVLTAEETAPMIGKMINEMNVDAVTVQELDSCRAGTGRFQLKYLVNNIPNGSNRYNYFFGSNIAAELPGMYGIGVILDKKHRVVNKFHHRMSKYDGAEVRGFCVMESDHFVVISTHLDHKSIDARQQQMLDINREVKARYQNSGKLVFLAGDFNGNQSGGVVINAKQAWTRVSSDDYTSTAKNPKNTIDHMFILNNGVKYKIREARALTKFQDASLNVKQASDHLPIFIEFEFYVEKK